MKQLKIEIERSSFSDRLHAYALCKKADTIKASDYLNIPFKVKDFVISKNTLLETDSGEVLSDPMQCITILTDEGISIGTNSKPMINMFLEVKDLLDDEGKELNEQQFIISQGTGKNGKFNAIELVF